jgi:hypothetical protein
MRIIRVEEHIDSMPNNHQVVLELRNQHWKDFMDSMLISKQFHPFLKYLIEIVTEKIEQGSTNTSLRIILKASKDFYEFARSFEEKIDKAKPAAKIKLKYDLDQQYERFIRVVSRRLSEALPYEL